MRCSSRPQPKPTRLEEHPNLVLGQRRRSRVENVRRSAPNGPRSAGIGGKLASGGDPGRPEYAYARRRRSRRPPYAAASASLAKCHDVCRTLVEDVEPQHAQADRRCCRTSRRQVAHQRLEGARPAAVLRSARVRGLVDEAGRAADNASSRRRRRAQGRHLEPGRGACGSVDRTACEAGQIRAVGCPTVQSG